jgi:hypothetical protein
MIKIIRNKLAAAWAWYEGLWDRRRKNMTQIMDIEDQQDRKSISDAEIVIVQHQYMKHMAQASLDARARWRSMQAAARAEHDRLHRVHEVVELPSNEVRRHR